MEKDIDTETLRIYLREFMRSSKMIPTPLLDHGLIYAGGTDGTWDMTEAGRQLLGLPEDRPVSAVTHPEYVAEQERLNTQVRSALDMVNQPPHYTAGGVECIDAIRAALTPEEFRGFCKGNAIKYVWREKLKGGNEDLKKAGWYLNKVVE